VSLQRFQKEARLLAEAQSPFIANLIEIGEDQGTLYLAIEFVAGQSLAAFLREHSPLDERLALTIMCDVARGLAVAHERGIVHRDIKPENIFLSSVSCPLSLADREKGPDSRALETTDGPRTTDQIGVKLLDFGLARHVIESESLNLTKTGAVLGTPLYMAPEQCSGHGAVEHLEVNLPGLLQPAVLRIPLSA
jgi:serine/threonine protein kinase